LTGIDGGTFPTTAQCRHRPATIAPEATRAFAGRPHQPWRQGATITASPPNRASAPGSISAREFIAKSGAGGPAHGLGERAGAQATWLTENPVAGWAAPRVTLEGPPEMLVPN